jgi:hypothetical protein
MLRVEQKHTWRLGQSVAFDLRVADGVLTLHAFSYGKPYTLDVRNSLLLNNRTADYSRRKSA